MFYLENCLQEISRDATAAVVERAGAAVGSSFTALHLFTGNSCLNASIEEPMKTFALSGFIVLAIAVAVYIITSLRNVSRELMDPKDLPRATFEVTKWESDAHGAGYIFDDQAEGPSITVSAAKAFFRNTGTYVNVWQGKDIDESELTARLNNYSHESELIRLFVFDGFVPYYEKKRVKNVILPVGEFKKYDEKELEEILGLPQSSWHGTLNPEIIKKATIWHILTVRERAEYRGIGGLWMGGRLAYSFDWNEIEATRKERDVDLIGPVFLCIGEDANLAVEIRIRTNVFESFPVYQKIRNDYLPWDPDGEDGEPKPRTYINYIGEDGRRLRKIFEIWQRINSLDKNGHLRYPTEAYVRSVMNLHTHWESLMETFVGFVTLMESLLTPGDRQELTYKTAVRGAALLTSDPAKRMGLFQILDEAYKLRSQIVHEGRTDKEDPTELRNMISHNLTEIVRHIFLRYICLLSLGLDGELPEWVLPEAKKLSARNNGRPRAIAHILNSVVLDCSLTDLLEKRMEEWGVYEKFPRWIVSLQFEKGF